MTTVIISNKYLNLKDTLLNIDTHFVQSHQTIHAARNTLKLLDIDGIRLVAKSFKVPRILHKVIYSFFRSSKAKRSYDNAFTLLNMNVNTPEPVAYIHTYKHGLLDKSYFISVYHPYDFTIREVFHHKVQDVDAILRDVTKFTYDLHNKGIWHDDYSLGNILITKQTHGYTFALVDTNRIQFKPITAHKGLKNFNKFWAHDDSDLVLIAQEYAKLSSFDEQNAIDTVFKEARKLVAFTKAKNTLKQVFRKH